jgi:hypothetical protein
MWRRIVAMILFTVVSCNVFASTEDDFEPYIVHLVLGNTSLSKELVIYGDINVTGQYYVPLLQFSELMLLPWKESKNQQIEGWLFREDNKVQIDIKQKVAFVGGHQYNLKEADFINLYGDLYISSQALQTILPLELQFDTLAQVLTVETKKPFSIEEQIAREEMLKKWKKNNAKRRSFKACSA